MKNKYEISVIQAIIDINVKARDELIRQYGKGTRPSWVSADLAHHGYKIDEARNMLKETPE